jgi:hypothetical protein
LALNRARLPEPREAVISRFRAALEACGIDTGSWWQQQLDLCTIGARLYGGHFTMRWLFCWLW